MMVQTGSTIIDSILVNSCSMYRINQNFPPPKSLAIQHMWYIYSFTFPFYFLLSLTLFLILYPSLCISILFYLSFPLYKCYLSPKGTTVWYNNPPPGRLLPNNTAISVHTDVSEVRCYTGDTSTNNDATLILKPVGSSQPLTFTNREAGYLRKNGQTSIASVANGVYTCQYTNSSGGVSYTSFAVFPRTREPSSGSSNTSKWQCIHYHEPACGNSTCCYISLWGRG